MQKMATGLDAGIYKVTIITTLGKCWYHAFSINTGAFISENS